MENQKFNKIENAFLELLSSWIKDSELEDIGLSFDEWKDLIYLANAHNISSLIFMKALEMESFKKAPIYSSAKMRTMNIVASQIRRTDAFLSIYKELLKEDIHPIVMKGIICRQLYGEYADYRPSGDEDILIQIEEYEKVCKILVENGYIPEYESVTKAQLGELQEITFSNLQTGLTLEVHTNPIGHKNSWRRQINDCFKDALKNSRVEIIENVPVTTMGHTDHMLFLILHAFKHLTGTGFGIRQVLDILLYMKKYRNECDWKYINQSLKTVKGDLFFIDLVHIGNNCLGFNNNISEKANCPDDLLIELLECGIFGNETAEKRTASILTNAAVSGKDKKNNSRIKLLLYAAFPSKDFMLCAHPNLQEKPWLLPWYWMKRFFRFIARSKNGSSRLTSESIKISNRRIELLKRYELL